MKIEADFRYNSGRIQDSKPVRILYGIFIGAVPQDGSNLYAARAIFAQAMMVQLMLDIVFLLAGAGFFVVAIVCTFACDRL